MKKLTPAKRRRYTNSSPSSFRSSVFRFSQSFEIFSRQNPKIWIRDISLVELRSRESLVVHVSWSMLTHTLLNRFFFLSKIKQRILKKPTQSHSKMNFSFSKFQDKDYQKLKIKYFRVINKKQINEILF